MRKAPGGNHPGRLSTGVLTGFFQRPQLPESAAAGRVFPAVSTCVYHRSGKETPPVRIAWFPSFQGNGMRRTGCTPIDDDAEKAETRPLEASMSLSIKGKNTEAYGEEG